MMAVTLSSSARSKTLPAWLVRSTPLSLQPNATNLRGTVMFRQTRSLSLALLVSASLMPLAASYADDLGNGWSPSPLEILQTPPYCQKQFNSNHNAAVMSPLFGGCERMNHFCPGIVLINRASDITIPTKERQRILKQAKIEINYSLSKLTSACVVYNDVKVAEQRIKLNEMFLK